MMNNLQPIVAANRPCRYTYFPGTNICGGGLRSPERNLDKKRSLAVMAPDEGRREIRRSQTIATTLEHFQKCVVADVSRRNLNKGERYGAN
jgi:hypothetical protein